MAVVAKCDAVVATRDTGCSKGCVAAETSVTVVVVAFQSKAATDDKKASTSFRKALGREQ